MPYTKRSSKGATWGEHLYLIDSTAERLTKVGRSWDPERRCRDVAHACPFLGVRLLAVYPGAGGLEMAVHAALRAEFEEVGREWFRASGSEVLPTLSRVLAANA